MKCYECGKRIYDRGVTMPGIPASFCDVECYKKHCKGESNWEGVGRSTAKLISPNELQKHEEIKQKAWEFYLHRTTYNDNPKAFAGFAWQYAEEFYEFAKEKEGKEDA